MESDAIVTGVVKKRWILGKNFHNLPNLRLQFVRVEPHCGSYFGQAKKGSEHFDKE